MIYALLNTPYKVLRFFPLLLDCVVMAVFVDAGFGANPDSLSQLSFIITLIDKF